MRVMIAAGGTGGHIYPALAVARELRRLEPDCEITFVGRPEGLERREFGRNGDRYVGVRIEPLPHQPGWKTLRVLGGAAVATGHCAQAFIRSRPDVGIGFGGYVSAPAVLAAQLVGVPTAIHEQNAVPGKVNRWLANCVGRVFLSYADSGGGLPSSAIEWSGMPIRPEAVGQTPRPEEFGLHRDRPTLFFLGGSQGARKLGRAAVDCIRLLSERGLGFQAILQTGPANYAEISRESFPVPTAVRAFLEDMGNAYACSSVVIARAGASSVAEIAANGLPAVFVPYPFAADDHQRKNVEPLARAGAARLLPDADLTGARLVEEITPLLESEELRAAIGEAIRQFARPGAAARIAERLLALAREPEADAAGRAEEIGSR